MERLDIVVATAGGVILVIAIVGATLSGGATGALYDVTVHEETKFGAKIPLTLAPAGGRANATFTIADANVTQVSVHVYANATVFPSGATMHVTLTSPTGNKTEKDGTTGLGVAITFLGVTVDAPAGAAPASQQVRAGSTDEAARRVSDAHAAGATGNWTLDVAYAPAGPVPPSDVAVVALPSWTVWTANAALTVPASR